MKYRNEYTKGLTAPSRYNPNDFTATGAAVFYIVMLLAFFALPYILRATGFVAFISEAANGDSYLILCVYAVISQAFILSFSLVFCVINGVNPVRGGGYENRFDFTPILFGCALVVGVQICFSPLHMEFAKSASFGTGGTAIDPENLSGNPLWVILYLYLTVLLPCVCEEIAFRGIIMRGLSRFGFFASVTLSAAMFALFHGNFNQLILQFLGGVAIGACVYVTKNFAVGAAMHFFNNLFAYAFAVFAEVSSSVGVGNVVTAFSVPAGVIMLLVGCYYFANFLMRKSAIENGKRRKPVPVLMSAESRVKTSSIIIDASQVKEFRKYYPDAMRYSRGGFVSLNRERKSAVLPVVLLSAGVFLALAVVVLDQFGI
ncbi:MAG: CPBP family intramembrane metalloprotease [Clostridia bacterium]|nr:CPBP family intramembrane metalloprotease [Clostridia bacterium]